MVLAFTELPADLVRKIFTQIPMRWFFGRASLICKTVGMWASKYIGERVAVDQNKIAQVVGGYKPDNVTSILLFYKLLSQLRSNSFGL